MSFSQADIDRLDKAIASGRMRVTDSDGRTTVYRGVHEMLKARARIAAELAGGNKGISANQSVGIFERKGGC